MPSGFAAIGQPVSVCHQLSTTGMSRPVAAARVSVVHAYVSGSSRSPARNTARSEDRSAARACCPGGSSPRTTRMAVGAVKKTLTSCCSMTRKNALASGVPTGLPSYKTVVTPAMSGA